MSISKYICPYCLLVGMVGIIFFHISFASDLPCINFPKHLPIIHSQIHIGGDIYENCFWDEHLAEVDTPPLILSTLHLPNASLNTAKIKQYIPTIYNIVKNDKSLLKLLQQYLAILEDTDAPNTIAVDYLRNRWIIPSIDAHLAHMNELEWVNQEHILDRELASMEIQTIHGEKMYAGLGPTILSWKRDKTDSLLFTYYQVFSDAHSEIQMSPHPFSSLLPYLNMINVGKKMETHEHSLYAFPYIKEDYLNAIHLISNIYMEKNSDGSLVPTLKASSTFPITVDLDEMYDYLDNEETFPFKDEIKRILAFPSIVHAETQDHTRYLIATDRVRSREEGQQRIYEYLSDRKDIPYVFEVKANQTEENTDIFVVYRFFEEKKLVEEALQRLEKQGIKPEVVPVSLVKGNWVKL